MPTHSRFLVAILLAACGGTQPPGGPALPAPVADDASAALANDVDRAVFRPRFETAEGFKELASAFVLAPFDDIPALLVTAHLVFGLDGGMSHEYGWHELGPVVVGATARNSWDSERVLAAGAPLVIEGAARMTQHHVASDVAALPIHAASTVPAMRLATTRPQPEERVWVLVPSRDSATRPSRHAAVIAQLNDDEIMYLFEAPVELTGMGGAPVVNSANELVAIHLAGAPLDGKVVAVGNPWWAFAGHLTRAWARRNQAVAQAPGSCPAGVEYAGLEQGGACLEPAQLGAEVVASCARYLHGQGWRPDAAVADALGNQTGKRILCFKAPAR